MKALKKILVCDDDPLFRKTLEIALREYGSVTLCANSDEALQLLKNRSFDLMILDIQMRTQDEGLQAIPKIRELDSDLTLIVMSGLRDFHTVRAAMRSGATDYLSKDFDPEEFKLIIERSLGTQELRTARKRGNFEAATQQARHVMIGESQALSIVRKSIERFRNSPANVLITGETGTGKEIAARGLRKNLGEGGLEPFVAVDSATLHSQTAESILFGHEKGAFTGADGVRRGLFEEADGGLLFFDEIGNMPINIQAKLLRVLQEKEITRLGSTKVIPLEFRVVAATNRNLEAMTKTGEFLPDLLQRLNVLPIQMPAFRERLEDLPLLVNHFLRLKGAHQIEFSEDALTMMKHYDWPGNVRELNAMIDYSLAMLDGNVVGPADLHPKLREFRKQPSSEGGTYYDRVEQFEKGLLSEAYQTHSGNISQMALALGMDRSHLHTKLKQHKIHAVKAK